MLPKCGHSLVVSQEVSHLERHRLSRVHGHSTEAVLPSPRSTNGRRRLWSLTKHGCYLSPRCARRGLLRLCDHAKAAAIQKRDMACAGGETAQDKQTNTRKAPVTDSRTRILKPCYNQDAGTFRSFDTPSLLSGRTEDVQRQSWGRMGCRCLWCPCARHRFADCGCGSLSH